VRPVKVKNHTGFLVNKRADGLAERDRPGGLLCPSEIWVLCLKVQPNVRALSAQCQKTLPRQCPK
jgi:hypothetical protein